MKPGDLNLYDAWNRRKFIGTTLAATAALAATSARAAETTPAATASGGRSYLYHGRPDGYAEFKVIEPGRRIDRIESFHNELFTLHLGAAIPNLGPFVEWSIEKGALDTRAAEVFSPALFIKDGRAHCEAGPGWGVKINPEWLKSATYQKSEYKK